MSISENYKNQHLEERKENINDFLQKYHIKKEDIKGLTDKDFSILPVIDYSDKDNFSYNFDTINFIHYLKEQDPNIKYGVPSQEANTLSLNSIDICLGSFLINSIFWPIFISLTSNYIYDNFIKKDQKVNIQVSFNIVKERNTISKSIKFEGDAETFIQSKEYFLEILKNE